jgi:hypothetical protein
MTDANGWHGAPGVPKNPEQTGPHWVAVDPGGTPCVVEWNGFYQGWSEGDSMTPPSVFAETWGCYLGPCHTPAEVAALVAAGQEAMREACAKIVEAHAAAAKRCSEEPDVIYRIRAEFLANSYAIQQAANDVRVTPISSEAAALARVRAEARRAGMEEAAGIAEKAREKAKRGAAEEWGYANSPQIRERLYARSYEAGEIAAAIRAAAKEITP